MEESIENQDSLKPEEDLDESLIVPDEEGEPSEKIAKLDEANKKLYARAKKAETELKAFKLTPKEVEKPPVVQPKVEDLDKVLDQKLNEKLEERELDSLEVSDELKRELKTYAKAGGLSIKQTLQSDYFKFLKDKEEAKRRVDEASIGGKHRTPTRKDFDPKIPFQGDLSTEEGRNDYEEWKKVRASKV